MESNGEKGKIHVSQATADALIKAGKEKWLTEREDRIVAKGKGEMVTYWVQVNSVAATSLRSSLSHYEPDDDDEPLEDKETLRNEAGAVKEVDV